MWCGVVVVLWCVVVWCGGVVLECGAAVCVVWRCEVKALDNVLFSYGLGVFFAINFLQKVSGVLGGEDIRLRFFRGISALSQVRAYFWPHDIMTYKFFSYSCDTGIIKFHYNITIKQWQ